VLLAAYPEESGQEYKKTRIQKKKDTENPREGKPKICWNRVSSEKAQRYRCKSKLFLTKVEVIMMQVSATVSCYPNTENWKMKS